MSTGGEARGPFCPWAISNSRQFNRRVTGGIPLFVYWSPVVIRGQLCSSEGVTGLISEFCQVSRRSSPLHTGLLTATSGHLLELDHASCTIAPDQIRSRSSMTLGCARLRLRIGSDRIGSDRVEPSPTPAFWCARSGVRRGQGFGLARSASKAGSSQPKIHSERVIRAAVTPCLPS